MLHGVAGDQSASSSQACLAVDGKSAVVFLCDLKKFIDDFHGRHATIGKVQLMMADAILDEVIGLVGFVIQPNHSLCSEFLEDRRVVLRSEGSILS